MKEAKAGDGDCPEILPGPDSSGNRLPMAELAERFESGLYFCEGVLAAKALAIIKETE